MLRFVTAASLFDGHDASINIMRRMLQSKGVEVIHLGHNRSAVEVVWSAFQEDVDAVAISSYQGGHNEYLSYVRETLDKGGRADIKIFAGGGGVITPSEVKALEKKGIEKIYTPEDGMLLGIDGIIEDMLRRCRESSRQVFDMGSIKNNKELDFVNLALSLSHIERKGSLPFSINEKNIPVLGITGTGGAGKSSLIDELLIRFHHFFPDLRLALISIDPTRKKTQGALLGDRIRLSVLEVENFYIRSMATRGSGTELSPEIKNIIQFLKGQNFDLIIVETSGIGQVNSEIHRIVDKCLYVMTPEYGAQTQLEKIEMLDLADYIVLNKFDRPDAEDAYRDVIKQYRRNHEKFDFEKYPEDLFPVFGTIASQFNDAGVNSFFHFLCQDFNFSLDKLKDLKSSKVSHGRYQFIPPGKRGYLRKVSDALRDYNAKTEEISSKIDDYFQLKKIIHNYKEAKILEDRLSQIEEVIGQDHLLEIKKLNDEISSLKKDTYSYKVRNKEIKVKTKTESLSHLMIPKLALPNYSSPKDQYIFIRNENLPGHFPYTSGIFPFKRTDEDPKRQFAGEGGPKRTNQRFHYLCQNDDVNRLSTAFDSVTLYGEDPDKRPDIYGKIGESGVSICTLDDMEDLYDGLNLTKPTTSVSMTINGPAPIILAMYLNAAVKEEVGDSDFSNDKFIEIISKLRGTVQADILKEDQAQNTCIFSLPFSLKLMGDVQEYFVKNKIKNYYTISISGYHIAEAGANPITQLAFTLANGFTYIEYFLNRGLKINDFASNLAFFFSNGLDPEYTVLGRVARKIWAVAMRDVYGADESSQKFKYHIQTSGRSLHAQEIDFNDIRTTLQAFLALTDNCNSLHTNAYDEAITTPTEESVRRAMAIQMIIGKEFGLMKTDNVWQGSFYISELMELVEEAVLKEFDKISDKGGVLGSMERMYQRSQIQEESLYYETLKSKGELPIIGVNTFVNKDISDKMQEEIEMSRSNYEEKDEQIQRLEAFKKRNSKNSKIYLERLKKVANDEGNIFEELLHTVKYCSLGQISNALYDFGGKYRRNV